MPEQPPDTDARPDTTLAPVVFVHADGVPAATDAWVQGLRDQGLAIFSHRPLAACARTRASIRELGQLLAEIAEAAPGRPLLILRAGLALERGLLAELVDHAGDGIAARTSLSNTEPTWNPFAGTLGKPPGDSTVLAGAVRALGPGLDHRCSEWPAHCLLLSAAAVTALAQPDLVPANALARLAAAGSELVVNDRHFIHDPHQALQRPRGLDPHETPCPPPWGTLSSRLQAWLEAGAQAWPEIDRAQAATLHVTHSWGGGVARWISEFIGADGGRPHLQLRAEAPQSGDGAGQRLSLYAGDRLDCPLASWWLQPPIASVDTDHGAYREILRQVIARYRVGEIIVSSLVGHSLDALDSGLPTLQVLHDHFPLWPLLSVPPGPYLEAGSTALEQALADPASHAEFMDRDSHGWAAVAQRYLAYVREHGIRLVAPSEAAARLYHELAGMKKDLPIEVIPHGTAPLPQEPAVQARPRGDGRLRLLVPGRIQPGKGKALLLEALPRLRDLAQVTLLGAGKHGEEFFGLPGVNVISQYRPDELRELVAGLAPDAAALLSLVPETFSFTLSEMRQLGVPVIATRVGSFPERIEDGVDGWLIDPDADALVEMIEGLQADRKRLESARRVAPPRATADMVAAYRGLLQAAPPGSLPPPADPQPAAIQAGAQAWLAMRERAGQLRLRDTLRQLESEVRQRTAWALDRDQALQEAQRSNRAWVEQLQAELAEQRQAAESARQRAGQAERQLEQLKQDFDRLQESHDQVLASSSWRLTRPLRVLRRLAGNFMLSRAWNPLRWPLLIAGLVRNLTTVGWRGTLMRMQNGGYRSVPEGLPLEQLESIGNPEPPSSVPESDAPLVSVVIPVYNNWIYTAACLRSIAEARNSASCEVIVVDDCSDDETAEGLRKVQGLNVLRNDTNTGFIDSCNRGAEMARGRYLVLLNNDTQVTEDWLDHLLDAFAQHPDAGLVGARLLYPDGRLQECGGIVFKDGSGWNYGREDNPNRSEYMHLREADYCSGACFMIETSLFRELGGFDTRYRPAYYEDTDLAFRVRAAHRKVLVQPRSTVVHHEGITSGTDTDSGTKRFQVINREKFAERWAAELAGHPPRIEDPTNPAVIRDARDHRLRGRVLFIDATTPEPDQDSGSLRLRNLMRCFLDVGYGVSFMAENHAHAGRYTRALQQLGVEVLHEPWVASDQAFLRNHGAQFDIVIVSRHYVASRLAPLIRKHCPRARLVFDTVDLHYLREQRLAELENSLPLHRVAQQTRRSELAVIGSSDAVLVVSEAEVGVLAQDAPGALVHVLSNIHEVPGRRLGFEERQDLFFVGGYQHPPNVDAALWFVGRIWPLIKAELPEVRFHLVGSKAPDRVRALDGGGVVFHGFVADLEHFLDHCRLAVAPLRYGAGVKGKVNMSMSHGQPVVATPMAVEGIGAEHGRDVLIAETEAEFAREVVRLYRDEALWQRISDGAVANVQARFSMDAARRSIEELIGKLGAP